MPVLIRETRRRLPGNRAIDSQRPSGIPRPSAKSVARPGDLQRQQGRPGHLGIQGRQHPERLAESGPDEVQAYCSRAFRGRSQEGLEQWDPELVQAELADGLLGGRAQEELHEGFGASDIDARVPLRVDRDHMIDVQEIGLPLDKDDEVQPRFDGEEGPPVRQRIARFFRGDPQGLGHSLAGLEIPLPRRGQAGPLPQALFLLVRARGVGPGNEDGPAAADRPEGVGGREAPDLGRVRGRTDDHEVVGHQLLPLPAEPGGHELLLVGRRMDDEDVGASLLSHPERFTAAHGDRLDAVRERRFKARQEDVEEAGVLKTRGRRQDQIVGRPRARGSGPKTSIAPRTAARNPLFLIFPSPSREAGPPGAKKMRAFRPESAPVSVSRRSRPAPTPFLDGRRGRFRPGPIGHRPWSYRL